MKEGDRKIRDLVPEVAKETDEKVTDELIDELLLHRQMNSSRLEELKQRSTGCAERVKKLESTFSLIDAFLALVEERFPVEHDDGKSAVTNGVRTDRVRIREALALMLKIHINQPNRIESGDPFISHPLKVAHEVLETYKGNAVSHVTAAALLHDSIEDQSRLLSLERGMMPEWHPRRIQNVREAERDEALRGLGLLFGLHTQLLVNSLTSPAALKTSIAQHEKNVVYENYIRRIFTSETIPRAVSAIKWADLKENALTIGGIYKKGKEALAMGNQEEGDYLMGMYKKLNSKYQPILQITRDFFENVAEDHPLYEQREQAIVRIDNTIASQYGLT